MKNGYKRQNTQLDSPSVPITMPSVPIHDPSVALTMVDSKETTPVDNNINHLNLNPELIKESLKAKEPQVNPDLLIPEVGKPALIKPEVLKPDLVKLD